MLMVHNPCFFQQFFKKINNVRLNFSHGSVKILNYEEARVKPTSTQLRK